MAPLRLARTDHTTEPPFCHVGLESAQNAKTRRSGSVEAQDETRTRDPILTMDVLYQLSYLGRKAPNPSPMRNRGSLQDDSIGPRLGRDTRSFRWFRGGLGHERCAVAQTISLAEGLGRLRAMGALLRPGFRPAPATDGEARLPRRSARSRGRSEPAPRRPPQLRSQEAGPPGEPVDDRRLRPMPVELVSPGTKARSTSGWPRRQRDDRRSLAHVPHWGQAASTRESPGRRPRRGPLRRLR
jgi:hypothetical protein